ncbi:MAG: bifunctional folylpolyglutamate synthase/dihydrofolate synthase [Clostridiales bacterium]|nr:bifunctional folylpolyglutamate synthase/dihydrofolate synthase [Clostridiales bacterium]
MIDINAPEFLQSANKFGIKLGLDRMLTLLEKLGNPEKSLSAIHVAGTNGKGSVCAYCAGMLAWEGKKVGLYTSPFLERFSERIRILDGREGLLAWERDDAYGEIDHDSLFRLTDLVREKVDEMLTEGLEHPTEFELVTAVAFLYFAEQNCDVVVLETGLGGRLDSTNVIEKPLACIITALGYDHMDRLGDTLPEIAAEKGGIIKEGCPVFAMDTHQAAVPDEDAEEAAATLASIAYEKDAPLKWIRKNEAVRITQDLAGQRFFFDNMEFRIRMHGAYQLENASLAILAMSSFVSEDALHEGIAHVMWKGRLEVLSQDPTVILDGAHNPQGITSFCAFAEEMPLLQKMRPCEVIMGVMADKDVEGMLNILIERWCVPLSRITLVTPDQKRAMRAAELRHAWDDALKRSKSFYNSGSCMYNAREKLAFVDDAETACRSAIARARRNRAPLYVIGSLYLLGEVRSVILEELRKSEKSGET